jgi:hypothetical protein
MSFDIAKLARNFNDVSNVISQRRTLTSADREIIRMRLDNLRLFLGACEMHKTEIEQILNWVSTPRGTTPHGSR